MTVGRASLVVGLVVATVACAPDGAPPAATEATSVGTTSAAGPTAEDTATTRPTTTVSGDVVTDAAAASTTVAATGAATTTDTAGSSTSSTTTTPGTGGTTSTTTAGRATTTTATTVPRTTVPRTTVPTTTVAPATPLATAAARAGLDRITAQLAPGDVAITLTECPLDPTDVAIDALFSAVPTAGASTNAPTESGVYELFDDAPVQVGCDRFSDDLADAVGVLAMAPPADLTAFVTAFANPDGLASVTVSVEPGSEHSGGRFFRICSVDSDDPTLSYCEVDWLTADLLVGAYVAGADSERTDLAAFETALAAQLPTFLDRLATT
jgi:hypothetical protein